MGAALPAPCRECWPPERCKGAFRVPGGGPPRWVVLPPDPRDATVAERGGMISKYKTFAGVQMIVKEKAILSYQMCH